MALIFFVIYLAKLGKSISNKSQLEIEKIDLNSSVGYPLLIEEAFCRWILGLP